MKKSEISFADDFREFTSPSVFLPSVALPILLTFIINKEKVLLNFLIVLGMISLILIILVFIRWLFFYRKKKLIWDFV